MQIWGAFPNTTYGDIEVMNNVGFQQNLTIAGYHAFASNGTPISTGSNYYIFVNDNNFHTYTLDWSAKKLLFYVDSVLFYTLNSTQIIANYTWPFDNFMNLFINFAVGGSCAGSNGTDNSAFPSKFIIDYIRVYSSSVSNTTIKYPTSSVVTTPINYLNLTSYTLVWSDEFNYTGAPDPSQWAYAYFKNDPTELQCYTNSSSDSYVINETLIIQTNYVNSKNITACNYTSAELMSQNSFMFGLYQMRSILPKVTFPYLTFFYTSIALK